MKKSNLIKLFSILLIGAILIMFSTNVFAAENNTSFLDLTGNYAGGSGNTNTGNINSGNINLGNTNTGNTNTGNMNNAAKTNNSNIYENTSLPQTGIEDSIPVALLVVIFGISAIYAYKKIKEYRNV